MNHAHQVYRARRDAILQTMRGKSGGGLALLPTAPEVPRNRDSLYPFRHDSYFYYLSGFPEPEAVIALVAGPRRRPPAAVLPRQERRARDLGRLSLRPRRRARDLRLRRGAPDRRARRRSCPDLASDRPALFTPLGLFADWDRQVTDLLNEVRSRARTGVSAPEEVVDMRAALDAMRLVKDRHEIGADAPCRGDLERRAPPRDGSGTRPGWYEYQVEAELAHEFLTSGRAGRRLFVDRRRRVPTPACCTTATTTARCRAATCC